MSAIFKQITLTEGPCRHWWAWHNLMREWYCLNCLAAPESSR